MKVSSVPTSRPLSRTLGSLPRWTTRVQHFHTPTPSSTSATNRAHVNPQAMLWSSRQLPMLKTSRLWWPGSRTAPRDPACLRGRAPQQPLNLAGPWRRRGQGAELSCREPGCLLIWLQGEAEAPSSRPILPVGTRQAAGHRPSHPHVQKSRRQKGGITSKL